MTTREINKFRLQAKLGSNISLEELEKYYCPHCKYWGSRIECAKLGDVKNTIEFNYCKIFTCFEKE